MHHTPSVAALLLLQLIPMTLDSEETPPATTTLPADRYDYRERVLENGLRVVTLEDPSCPIVAVQVWYHVGSKDESSERNGFAHMFEHMMFRGTDRLGPTDHFDLVRKTGGSCNAYTSFDNTTYINVGPSNQLELLLWLEAERMSALKIDEGGFDTERKVVEEERRMGLNQPYGTVLERVLPEVFPGHPYSWSPIGNIPHLRAATVDELQSFWDRFYVPNNAVLVVVGDIEHAKAQELVERVFSWIPRCPEPARIPDPAFERKGPIRLRLKEKKGPVPIVGIGYRVVPMSHPDSAALEVLGYILGQGESSRLYRSLVVDKKLVAFAAGGMMQLEQAGLFGAGAALTPFGKMKKVEVALEEELEKLRRDGVTEKELVKAKNILYRQQVEARLHVESKAEALGRAATLLGGTEEANRAIERFRAVSVDDVQRVAHEYLVDERRATLHVKPTLFGMISSILGARKGKARADETAEDGGEKSSQVAAGRRAVAKGPKSEAKRPEALSETPPLAAPLDSLPPIGREERTLENGLRVVVVPNHEVPFFTARLCLTYGACDEPIDKPGTAAMACALLTKGTKHRSAAEIAEELESYAIDINGAANHDTSAVSASAVSEHFERAVERLAEIILEPSFPEEELATLVRVAKTGKLVEEKEPSYRATRQFDRILYGEHPYSRPADGRAADLDQLRVGDLRRWWETFARPDAATLYLAGDVEASRVFDKLNQLFSEWKAPEGGRPVRQMPAFPEASKTAIYLVNSPGAFQSQIRIGHRSVLSHRSPEYATSTVLNQVFGGSFGARLNSTVRVEKGLTYSIGGGFSASLQSGEFQVSTFTQTPKTAEAVRVILGEIDRLLMEAPSDEEMDFARSYLTGSAARRRETPQQMIGDLWAIQSLGLEKDFFERRLERVASLRAQEVIELARTHVHPKELVVVVVGEAKKIRAELEAIAPVTLVP